MLNNGEKFEILYNVAKSKIRKAAFPTEDIIAIVYYCLSGIPFLIWGLICKIIPLLYWAVFN